MQLPHLHDAVLRDFNLVWDDACTVRGLFATAAGKLELLAEGVSLFQVPREDPWGPSVHVNNATATEPSQPGRERLELEMQSGDTIVIEAEKLTWSVPGS